MLEQAKHMETHTHTPAHTPAVLFCYTHLLYKLFWAPAAWGLRGLQRRTLGKGQMNGVSTNGVTANFIFVVQRDLLGIPVNILSYLSLHDGLVPKNAGSVRFPEGI